MMRPPPMLPGSDSRRQAPMDLAPLINAFRQIGGWHSFGVALALSPLAFAILLRGWAPSGVEFGLAVALAGAAGFTLGGLFSWLAGTVAPRRRMARATAAKDAALVKQIAFLGADERASWARSSLRASGSAIWTWRIRQCAN